VLDPLSAEVELSSSDSVVDSSASVVDASLVLSSSGSAVVVSSSDVVSSSSVVVTSSSVVVSVVDSASYLPSAGELAGADFVFPPWRSDLGGAAPRAATCRADAAAFAGTGARPRAGGSLSVSSAEKLASFLSRRYWNRFGSSRPPKPTTRLA